MVKAMTAAAAIPHFYLVDELKLDALVKLKNNLKDLYIEEGVKLTYLPLMIKALSVALLKYPLMNSTCNEDASTICRRGGRSLLKSGLFSSFRIDDVLMVFTQVLTMWV